MACVIELHLDIVEINEWLRADVGYGTINDLIQQRGHQTIPTSTLSRHRERCLGLPKKVVTARDRLTPNQLKVPPPNLPLPTDDELVEEVKRVIFWRLKTHPEKVQTSTLASILAASMREKKPEQPKKFEEILAQLGKDETSQTGTDMEEESDSEPSDGDS